jgi:precorrin-3B synthase
MEAGDGWIVRVRPSRGRIPARRLERLARLARWGGNGIIELTRRANLQIRGVSRTHLEPLRSELLALELACATPELEAQPQVLVSPLSGLDDRCPPLEPLAGAVEHVLATSSGAAALSHKFCIVLSGGDDASCAVAGDVHVRLDPAQSGARVFLGGTVADSIALGGCARDDVPELIRRLVASLASTEEPRLRLRDALRSPVLALLLTDLAPLLSPDPSGAPSWPAPGLGFHTRKDSWLSVQLPFGSASVDAWIAIAELAEQHGRGEVRLSPSREVLLPGLGATARSAAEAIAAEHGLRLERTKGEPELIACSGAPACLSARAETRALARALALAAAPAFGSSPTLHVSGCEKGCASSARATLTVVASASGYQLGWNMNVAETILLPGVPRAELETRLGADARQRARAAAELPRPLP